MNDQSVQTNSRAKKWRWPLSPETVRSVLSSHSVLGLAFAAIIYIVCLTGTVAVFAPDLERWEVPATPVVTSLSDASAARAIAEAARRAPADTTLYLSLPTAKQDGASLTAFSATYEHKWAVAADGALSDLEAVWTEFLLHLHINLHLPRSWGQFIVGLTGVALLSSLVSGILAHPRVLRDAFHLRLGGSRRLQEADLHNRLGIWALPFHFTLALTGAEPVACYGDGDVYCYVNFAGATDPGKAYKLNENGEVEDFVAVDGADYNVIYYERRADAEELGISGMFAPGVYTVIAQMAVFSAEGANAGNRGTQVGWAYYYIPRMQFGGNASVNGSQTDPATSALSGTALTYYDNGNAEACIDCNFPMLAYMTYVPLTLNGNNAIVGMTVIGGNIEIEADESMLVPVKYAMAGEKLAQPKYSDLTFTVQDTTKATVTGGVITGVATGTTTLTIAAPNGSNIAPITVGVTVTA